VRVETVQNECNPFHPEDFRNGLIEACLEQGITYIAYSPMGGVAGHRKQAHHVLLSSIGRTHGVSAYQVALAWLLTKAPHILPIPGASKPGSIQDSAAAAKLVLSDADLMQIDALME
jgi:diketogulonate reductase-like aldo/keto reductase